MPKVTIDKDVAVQKVLERLEDSKKRAERAKSVCKFKENIASADGRVEAFGEAIHLVKLWLEES